MSGDWTVVLPVKSWRLAKSRMAVSPEVRESIARALMSDTIDVVTRSARVGAVVVVSAEGETRSAAHRRGAVGLDELPLRSANPLNDAIRVGLDWALVNRPRSPGVVVPADLGALTVATFDSALKALAATPRSFVPDLHGTGTTLLSATDVSTLDPRYGASSALQHSRLGYSACFDVNERARLDIDTTDDLIRAAALGLGARTRAIATPFANSARRLVPRR